MLFRITVGLLLVFTGATIANTSPVVKEPRLRGPFHTIFDKWPFIKPESSDETEGNNYDDSLRSSSCETKEDNNGPPLLPPVFQATAIILAGSVEIQKIKMCFDFPKQRMAMWGIRDGLRLRSRIVSCKLGISYDFNSTQCSIDRVKCNLTRVWLPPNSKLTDVFTIGKRSAGIPVQLWTAAFTNTSGLDILVDQRDASPVSVVSYDAKQGAISFIYISNFQPVVDQSCFIPDASCHPSLEQNASPNIFGPFGNFPAEI